MRVRARARAAKSPKDAVDALEQQSDTTEEQKPMPALRASLGRSSVGTGMLASSVLYVANLREQDLVQNNRKQRSIPI